MQGVSGTAVERARRINDNQGQILALALRLKFPDPRKLFLGRLEAAEPAWFAGLTGRVLRALKPRNCWLMRGVSGTEPPPVLRTRSDPLFLGPRFLLALAGIRRLVVQIKAIEQNDLYPL